MKRTILAAAVAGSLALGGCATTGGTPINVQSFIEQVQAAASVACGFLPTAETVAQIIATGNPIVTTAGDVANAICKAVTVPPSTPPAVAARLRAAGPPTVAGVVIHGRRL
jgi:predicted small secreted protein